MRGLRFRNTRDWFRLALAAILAQTLSMTAASAEEKFKAVTTFTVIADMAKNVAGDAAIV